MDTLTAIMTRRSVRKFTNQPVAKDDITKILHAAMSAPSAVNEQPWHFLVINERALLDKINDVHKHAAMCLQAQVAIIPCIDTKQENYRDFWVEDMSAAMQNILLATRALGLGAVWLGVYPDNERIVGIRKLFKLPEAVIPFSIAPIGYTDVAQKEAPDRLKPERVHYNKW